MSAYMERGLKHLPIWNGVEISAYMERGLKLHPIRNGG